MTPLLFPITASRKNRIACPQTICAHITFHKMEAEKKNDGRCIKSTSLWNIYSGNHNITGGK